MFDISPNVIWTLIHIYINTMTRLGVELIEIYVYI
jgi:hypothetical protein